MSHSPADAGDSSRVRELYERAVAEYGSALERLTRAYEADAERRRDVLQEIHMALWESLARFDGRCALGTWVYRVAHNLVPVVVGQIAIAATMATSPRFTTSQFYPEGLVLFVGTAGVALVVIWRRWQLQAMELQRELEAISVSVSPIR